MADQSLQYLQQVITDVHALVAHEPDPQLKATYAKCLQAFLTAQHQKMNPSNGGQQQPSYGGAPQQAQGGTGANGIAQILNTLGGGR